MKRYTDDMYHKGKRELTCRFECLDTCVSICSDIWTDRWNENSYMGITCHWIDDKWVMHKRLIALRYMDGSHNAQNIYTTISTILREYRLSKKIFSIGFDNAAANTKSISELKRLCQPTLGGTFFHIRCACHILNLCVKGGLETLQIKYHPIKEVVGYLADHPTANKAWRRFCVQNGVKPRKFKKDVQHRWNSTYELLQSTVPYKEPLCEFISANFSDMPLHPTDWDMCGSLLQVLKIFYDCTKTFSRVYTPSVHLFIMEACNIVGTLNQVRSDVLLQGAINDMCSKWLDYYREIPMIFHIGMVLDPRFRVEGLRHYVNLYYQIVDELSDTQDKFSINPVQVVREAEKVFNELYNQFSFTYGGQIPVSPTPASTAQASRSEGGPPGIAAYHQWFRRSGGSSSSGAAEEITNYLSTSFEFGDNIDARDFQIMEWWRSHSRTFPILSRMARQVLAAPASNVAVEQAFSTAGLILDDRKSRMSAVTVEALACNDDWNRAEQRLQEMVCSTSEEDEYFSDFNTSGGSTGGSTPEHDPNE